jgi:peptide methionine sulfoxide reductase MsrA
MKKEELRSPPCISKFTANTGKAEEDHQDYLEKLPQGYTCHFLRPESVLGD